MRKIISLILLFTITNRHYVFAQQNRDTIAGIAKIEEDDDDDYDKADEGEFAEKFWNDLEKKINHVNALNGINTKNRQHIKVSEWKQVNANMQFNSSTNSFSLNGNWSQVFQSPDFSSDNSIATGMGRIETVAFHPTNANTFFVGTAGGGLWKTVNNGTSYIPMTDGLPSSGVTSIAIDPNNANNMYILTGSGLGGQSATSAGVFKSTDGGISWFATGLTDTIGGTDPLYGYDMKMHPTNADILFCATNRGLYKTIDAGDTWQLVLDGSQLGDPDYHEIFDVEFRPGDPTVVYAAYYGRIYYSKSSGDSATWQSSVSTYSGFPAGFAGNYISRISVSSYNPNTIGIAAGVDGSNAFITTYGTVFYIKATFNPNAASNAITYANPKSISACGYPCKRSGGGRAYADINLAQGFDGDILIGGVDFYASNDNGSTWTMKDYNCTTKLPLFHVDCGSKMTVQNGMTYVCTDGGIYRQPEDYSSNTSLWTDITAGMEITQLYTHDGSPQDANYYMYANQDNGTQIRTSSTSYAMFIGGDGTSCKFDKSNKNNFYGSIQAGEILSRSLNGVTANITPGAGATNGDELKYSGYGNFARCFMLDENNNNTLYAIKKSFYKSTNQGTSWTRYDIPNVIQPNAIMKVAKSNNLYIYAIETDWYNGPHNYIPQRFRVSTNGGLTWKDSTAHLPANIIISDLQVDPLNVNIIYITCFGNTPTKKVFMSNNFGLTWTSLSAGLPNVDVRCIALANDTKKGLYIGTDLGVYYRDNNIGNWTRFSNGLPIVQINNLYINPTLNTISAATYGRGIFVSDLYDPSSCPASLSLNSFYTNTNVFSAGNSITSTGIIFSSVQTNITFSSGDNIILQPGFVAQSGGGFRAAIEGCNPLPTNYKKDSSQKSSTKTIKKMLPKNKKSIPKKDHLPAYIKKD